MRYRVVYKPGDLNPYKLQYCNPDVADPYVIEVWFEQSSYQDLRSAMSALSANCYNGIVVAEGVI